jgi:hypothetical protein
MSADLIDTAVAKRAISIGVVQILFCGMGSAYNWRRMLAGFEFR